MTNENEFARKITTCLDAGTSALKAGTVYRLQQARSAALARLVEPERASDIRLSPAFAGAGGGSGTAGGRRVFASRKLWLGIALVFILAIGYQQWQAWQQASELAEVDTALLSSDLPIDAYLDRGFQNWLKSIAGDDGF
jgi:uncharacterized protein DUF3619